MKNSKRSNRFYDTSLFGHPQIRVYPRKGKGKKSPRFLLKCGCCDQRVEIHYAEDGLEIGGVNGAIEDWREICDGACKQIILAASKPAIGGFNYV
jgi:hypothetical protein